MISSRRKVIVIGGGAAGCGSALALAENGWKVSIFEKHSLFSGTTSKTAGRLGLGFHYMDFETSKLILRATMRFVKKFPECRVGESLPWSHPLRHGRYFITKNSIASPEKMLRVYESLKHVYSDIVKDDPSNRVFGPPEDFYRILEREEYENEVDMNIVILGIETAEHLLDWKKFEEHIVHRVKSHENISVEEHTKLVDVKRLESDGEHRFMLNFITGNNKKIVHGDYVVNSTWHEIEKINDIAGLSQGSISRTNRLKVILRVRLPRSMLNSHSMFFCIGPFCMFANLGDETALITYAPVTNISTSSEVSISNDMLRLLTQGPTDMEYCLLSEAIHRGATSFIPGLEHAGILDLSFGIVQTHGKVDLQNINSPVHKRAYFGVRSESDGWISNPCMKLVYLLENGDIVKDILENQFNKDIKV